jgi:parvulin-like peptidyl-prolyl isomerase
VRRLSTLLLLLLLCAPAAGQVAELVDRIVAVVDDDPIYLSDLERLLALGELEPEPGEDQHHLERRALERLIDQRLRFHEVDRHGVTSAPVAAVEAQVAALRERFGGEEGLARRLEEAGIDEERLRYRLGRQLRIALYIEERLGPRIFVDLDAIRAYYEGELTAEMARRGAPLPPLEQVREAIRALLRERQLDREIELWTAELRAKADVVDLLDRPAAALPPVVERVGG